MEKKYTGIGREMSDFEVRELKKEEFEEWDTLVEKSPQGTIFHKTSWLTSFVDYEFKIIVCTYRKNIVAGIPLTHTKRFAVKFAINPPFTPYLGIVFKEKNQKYSERLSFEKEISRKIAKNTKDFASYMDYSFHYNFVDAQPFIWSGFSVKPHYTYVLNLEENLDAILKNMRKKTRNRIVTSSKYDLEVSEGLPKQIVELMYLTHKRKNQRPPYSKEAYEAYLDAFSKNKVMKLIIIEDKDDLLAGGAIVYDSKRAYYLASGINPEGKYSGIGQLLIWMLIRCAKQELGLKEFDFEGSMNEGIEQFFRGFGGKLTPCYTIYKENVMWHLTKVVLKIRSKTKDALHLVREGPSRVCKRSN